MRHFERKRVLFPYAFFAPDMGAIDSDSGSSSSLHLTLSSMVFGMLGACISGILQLGIGFTQQKIPGQLEYFVDTVARPLVGAASALAVVILHSAPSLPDMPQKCYL